MGIEIDVKTALLIGTETLLTSLGYPLKYPGRTFTPPQNQRYIELVFLSEDGVDSWGGEKMFAGIIRAIVHWSNDDAGIIPPMTLCEQIASVFPKGTVLESGEASLAVITVPVTLDPLEDGQESLYPVTFRYRSAVTANL